MKKILNAFWQWYERHYLFNLGISSLLFLWQLIHLFWLSTHVVAERLTGVSYFNPEGVWNTLLILVDYTEIPALVGVSLVYLNQLRKQFDWKNFGMLIFLNSQWLHLFWITDEFVVNQFTGRVPVALPIWLAWLAILIDYLELPVMYDTIKKFIIAVRQKKLAEFAKEGFE